MLPRDSGEGLKLLLQGILRDVGAHDGVGHLAVLEEKQRRDRLDLVSLGEILLGVDIHLADLRRTFQLAGDSVDDRRDHLAGTAPLGPEVDEDGQVGFENVGIEVVFGEFERHGRDYGCKKGGVKRRPWEESSVGEDRPVRPGNSTSGSR